MLWQLQLSRKGTLSYVYMYPCSPISPSIQVPTKQWVGNLAFLWWQSVVPVVSLSGSDGKESAWNVEDPAPIPGSGRLPGEFHGQRSLAGYSPWHQKASDMTEWLTLNIYWVSFTYWYNTLGSNICVSRFSIQQYNTLTYCTFSINFISNLDMTFHVFLFISF